MTQQYRDFAVQEATRQGVDPDLVLRVIQQESGFNPMARSPKGAVGLMQLMPGTAADLGVNPSNWQENVKGGVTYLKQQLDRFQSVPMALAAYNAGPERVAQHGGIPPIKETQDYVTRITGQKGAKMATGNSLDAIFDQAIQTAMRGAQPTGTAPAATGQATAPVTTSPMGQEQTPPAEDRPATVNPMIAQQGTAMRERRVMKGRINLTPEQQRILEANKQFSPLSESDLENFRTGAGKFVADLGLGAQQIGAEAGEKLGLVSPETVQGLRNEADQRIARDAALMGTKAGLGGNIAASIAGTYPLIGATTGLNAAGMVGAGLAGLQPVGEQQSRTENALMGYGGGMTGQAAAKGMGRLIAPVHPSLTQEQRRLADVAEREGINLDLAQRTGSRPLKNLNAVMQNLPGSAGKATGKIIDQNHAFTSAILKRIGEDATEASPEVLNRARERISGVIEDVAKNNSISLRVQQNTPPAQAQQMTSLWNNFRQELTDTMNTYSYQGLASEQKAAVSNIIKDLLRTRGDISGQKYQSVRSELSRMAWDASNNGYARALRGIRDSLDDLAESTFKPQDIARLNEARTQWGLQERIARAAERPGGSSGLLSPSAMRAEMAKGQEGGYARSMRSGAEREVQDITKAGDAFLKPMADSTTGQRMQYQQWLTNHPASSQLLAGALGGGTGYLATQDPTTAIAGGALAIGVPRAAWNIVNNPAVMGYLGASPARAVYGNALTGVLGAPFVQQGALSATDLMRQ